jgi:hypothetical protein
MSLNKIAIKIGWNEDKFIHYVYFIINAYYARKFGQI